MSRFQAGLLATLLLAACASAAQLTPVWVELGPSSKAVARVVVESESDCPSLLADHAGIRMTPRLPVPDGFKLVCEAAIPSGTRKLLLDGRALPAPVQNPKRIVVIGDTGCRIKGSGVQNCNDETQWPFRQIADRAAAEWPELVIHVGDYLYREIPCPPAQQAFCGNTPSGDNWNTWNADFFTPAKSLLQKSVWAFSRGNHEDCKRSWRGWFYYLDPRPWTNGTCEAYSEPYVVELGQVRLGMLDSSATNDSKAKPDEVARYAAQLKTIAATGDNLWIVDHHPFWGLRTDKDGGPPQPLSLSLESAWEQAQPKGVSLILSGHVHLFEILSFSNGRAPQIVAGDGGTEMASAVTQQPSGMTVYGTSIATGDTKHEFGFTYLTRGLKGGWDLHLEGSAGRPLVSCKLRGSSVECGKGR
jgi:hypothetical protein